MTTTEEAARIRAAYKARSWSSRMVSVRAEYFSLGSEINIEFKDPRIHFADAIRIARASEKIHRCEITGEILGGGNRYLGIRYSHSLKDILARRHCGALEDAIAKLDKTDPQRLEPIDGCPHWHVGFDHHPGFGFRLWPPDDTDLRCRSFTTPADGALAIALARQGVSDRS
jgi:hypothetical protein